MDAPIEIKIACICAAAVFAFYWVYRAYTARSGFLTLDVFLLTYAAVPIIIFTPLAFSAENVMSTGLHFYRAYVSCIPMAFYMSVLGLACLGVSAVFFSSLNIRPPGLRIVEKSILNYWLTGEGCVVLSALTLLCLGALVALGGNPVELRQTIQEETILRPLFNLVNGLTLISTPIVLVAGHIRRDWRFTALALGSAACVAILGTRTPIVLSLLNYVVIRMIARRDPRVLRSAGILIASIVVLIVIALSLEGLRDREDFESTIAIAGNRLAYGNNLSDVRDFAWIMSRWDGKYLWGRTYASGALGIIPSNLFPWRREWAWAPFSMEASGIGRDAEHFGLRPGMFGEAYFNFGLGGVIAMGVILGALLGPAVTRDQRRQRTESENTRLSMLLCCIIYLQEFVLQLAMSSGWYIVFLTAILIGIGSVLNRYGWTLLPSLGHRKTVFMRAPSRERQALVSSD